MSNFQRFRIGLSLALLCGLSASAAPLVSQKDDAKTAPANAKRVDVSGDWKLTGTKREDPDPHEVGMSLKQQGDAFSGALTTNNGQFEIKEGKVKGSEITFSIQIPQQSITAACSGSIDGVSLKASCKMAGSTIDLAGTRQKKSDK